MSGSHDAGEPYRLLFEHNPQPMWVYDSETLEFLTVNAAAVARYGYTRDEFLGMRITDIRPPEDVPALLQAAAEARGSVTMPHVWRHRYKDGTIRLVEIISEQIVFGGRQARLVLANDVTEREVAIRELRRSHEEYERQYAALAALTRRGVLQTTSLDRSLREITRHTAQTLGVERVSVWRLTEEGDAIVARDLYERGADRHSADVRLAAADFPSYFQAISDSEVLAADDAERDPRTSEFAEGYLRPNGITSMLDAPILVDGALAGVLCLEHVGARRTWTAGERSFAVSAANLVALVLSQHSLARSRAWLQTILDSEPECVSLVASDGRLLEMNPAGLRMVEAADLSDVVGREAALLIHPSDRDAYRSLHRSVHDGATGQMRFRLVGLGGTQRWIETHAAPLRANGGGVVAVLSVTRDISDRMSAEAALRESERRLSTLMDHLPGMAYRCRISPEWPMEFVSNGAADLTGYDPEALLAGGTHPYASLVHTDDRQRVLQQVDAAVRADAPFEFEYRITTADGSEKWVWERGQAVHAPDGSPIALEGFVSDITQRRRSADAIRSSEERLRLLAQATSDAIYDWDPADDSVWWSEGADTMFGLTRDELGEYLDAWTALIHPDDRDRITDSLHAAVASRAETWSAEYRFRRGDGSYAFVVERANIIRDGAGRAVRVIGGVSDQTERKRLEDQLLQSQKMESVGRLAGGIAHDFNNLLTVILGTVDLSLSALPDGDPLATDLAEIRAAAERAAALTQQLLAFSRRQVLKPRVLDINTTIAGTLAMLRRLIGEDIEIAFTPGAELWNVRADPGQLEQVLLNLAVNARDAMPDGGRLSITTRNLVVDETYAAGDPLARPGPQVAITISDTGIGMDAETRSHAFEPFFTTKAVGKGTGLGLATVYGIVQQSGGSIRLYSEPGHGSTFRILLPRAVEHEPVMPLPPHEPVAGGHETILLVEDEDAVRRLTERVLIAAGYDVISVPGADHALAAIPVGAPVHLLLTDVVMPQMNGPDLARFVLERSPSTRVLFMSGYTDDAIVRRGLSMGQTRFLEKPFTVSELMFAVRAALNG